MTASRSDRSESAPRTFRPGLLLRVLGWGILLGFGGAVVALGAHVALHHAQMPSEELWSALWMGLFFALLALLGAGVQRSGFVLRTTSTSSAPTARSVSRCPNSPASAPS